MNKKSETEINRRGLFREGVSYLRKTVENFAQAAGEDFAEASLIAGWRANVLDPERGYLRPPGAVEESRFTVLCDKCDECIKACPENTLFAAPKQYEQAEGTPIFDPVRKPCFLCSDMYCISACKTGALVKVSTPNELSMGTARLDSSICLAYDGDECRYCIDFCPLSGQAMIELGGRPFVQAVNCVGCGLCEYHCVHDAGKTAIKVLPRPIAGP